jgi:hypothetical protein
MVSEPFSCLHCLQCLSCLSSLPLSCLSRLQPTQHLHANVFPGLSWRASTMPIFSWWCYTNPLSWIFRSETMSTLLSQHRRELWRQLTRQ